MAASDLSFLTFNIGNPSEQRAQRQLAWLAGRPENVLVPSLTYAGPATGMAMPACRAAPANPSQSTLTGWLMAGSATSTSTSPKPASFAASTATWVNAWTGRSRCHCRRSSTPWRPGGGWVAAS